MRTGSDQPLVLIIFGITGDLAQRKLLPALYRLYRDDELPEELTILGITRSSVTPGDVYKNQKQHIGDNDFDNEATRYLTAHTQIIKMDLGDRQAYYDLLKVIEEREDKHSVRLYYLSVPPEISMSIIELLGSSGHNKSSQCPDDHIRLLIEKPFGYDSRSAKRLINTVDGLFDESQIYRIDHYVAKETVQNILTFRFENSIFKSVWDNRHISKITIDTHEEIGINGRVTFYEQTGALRDLIQSHLLQLLAITTMDEPTSLDSAAIHAEKLKILKAIVPIPTNRVDKLTKRGQYIGYRQEVDNPISKVETFAQVNLKINNKTWRGVEIKLETGKALSHKSTEIVIFFDTKKGINKHRNELLFRIQPNEGITLMLKVKQPGVERRIKIAEMNFSYHNTFSGRQAEAYERVLVDAIRGDQTLFATAEEVIASWRIIDKVISKWASSADSLIQYKQGISPNLIKANPIIDHVD